MAKVSGRIQEEEIADEVEAPAFSEEALALAFATRHESGLRFVAKWGRWLHYDGGRWNFDDTRKVFTLARELCREAANMVNTARKAEQIACAKTRAAVVALAGEDYRLVAVTGQWDADPCC